MTPSSEVRVENHCGPVAMIFVQLPASDASVAKLSASPAEALLISAADDRFMRAIRTRTMVALRIWARAFGKPKEYDPREDRQPVRIDLTRLTLDQLALLRLMIESGAIRPAASEVDATHGEHGADP
jgi:hypothetical protein